MEKNTYTRKRTNIGQFQIYVAHLEKHAILRTSGQEDRQKFGMLWENLAAELNAYGIGPQRSPREWRNFLTQWKHQIRHESRKLKKQSMETGEGPASSLHLCDLKERALDLLGRVAVDGHNSGLVGSGVSAPVVTFAKPKMEDDEDSFTDEFAESADPLSPSSSTASFQATPIATSRKRSAEAETVPRLAAKTRQMDAIQGNDKVAVAISRLADRIGDCAEKMARSHSLSERLIENQERMMAMLLEKWNWN